MSPGAIVATVSLALIILAGAAAKVVTVKRLDSIDGMSGTVVVDGNKCDGTVIAVVGEPE